MSAVGPPRPEPADARRPQGLLAAARELLGMELAYLAELRDDALVLHDVDGDTAAFARASRSAPASRASTRGATPWRPGRRRRSSAMRGRSRARPRTPSCRRPGSAPTPAWPLRRPDGTVSGTLCCLSRTPRPDLGERDLRALDGTVAHGGRAAGQPRPTGMRASARTSRRRPCQALIAALNARENYTAEHSEAVVALALGGGRRAGARGGRAARGRPRRAAPRHRQGRRARRDPAEGRRR